jgi:curved DNA-binding protein
MEYKDYYKILGIERSASQDEIRKAYRKLAKTYHPDKNQQAGAEEKFKEIGEAYEVLKDPEKRKAYDQLGSNWKAGQGGFEPPPGWDFNFDFGGSSGGSSQGQSADFSSFFDELFGGGRAKHSHQHRSYSSHGGSGFSHKGEDVRAKIMIDLEDTLNGGNRVVNLQIPTADQQGRVINRPKNLNIKIPKGVQEGQTIRLSGQGGASPVGGQSGDLLLEVSFNPHKTFTLDGKDIYLNVPVAPWEAALGSKIKIPTPTGSSIEMKIPENSQQGRKMRLKGRGLPGKEAGDFYVVLQIALPPTSDANAKQFYEQMQKELSFDPRSYLF